jgi:hypothetical protein
LAAYDCDDTTVAERDDLRTPPKAYSNDDADGDDRRPDDGVSAEDDE